MLDVPAKHVVVEANPDLIDVLLDSRDRNRCAFTVLNRAVAYGDDETTFYRDPEFLASSVQMKTDDPVMVPSIRMRQIVDEYGFDRCTLICDIEGGEMDLVKFESDVLKDHVEMLIVEIHGWRVGEERADEMSRTLELAGFETIHEYGATKVFRNTRLAQRSTDSREQVGLSCGAERTPRAGC
jgi:FkbM family methyltransferase